MLSLAERELVLMKIRAPPGPTRMEVLQLVEIFRARVADVSERSITLCVTGDAGKASRAPTIEAGRTQCTTDKHNSTIHLYQQQQQALIQIHPMWSEPVRRFLARFRTGSF